MLKLSEGDKKFIDAIGDPVRLRILLALWKSRQELKVYGICRLTGVGRSSVRRHLDNLVGNGLVIRKVYGEIVLYSINKDDHKTNALTDFFKNVGL